LLKDISGRLKLLIDLQEHITKTLAEEPPASIRDGNMIRDGYNEELDELRDIAKNGKKYIAQIKDKLAKDSGIASLKIGYNKVFGYYIEVTNAHKDKVPEHFIRKQTLVNAERYITPELKEIEEKILSAEERSKTLEYELFEEVRLYVSEFADDIQQIAFALAELDCIQCFAEVAFKNNYAKPEVRDSEEISIKKGRHPVVEETLPMGEPFIPNDIELNNSDQQIMIITGPNMAGKSIILRQTGLIVLLAQVGSFVPAESATIGMVDKIFTRVGASDNLAAGESTFLVEMNEAANILNNATPRSLILLDEVGRGTSTFDGLSIAWSLAEYLHNHAPVAAKTLFATHYHELNELEQMYDRTKNFNVQVKEHDGKVIFLRKLVRGGADHSYGIQVANMAGLPQIVIDRAKDILKNLESHSLDITNKNGSLEGKASAQKDAAKNLSDKIEKQDEIEQMNLFATHVDPRLETVLNKLEASDPNRMTPIEALMMITELKKIVDR
jgi:DNA mismatch repair protein MutS